MSNNQGVPPIPPGILTPEQIEAVNGGLTCSAAEINQILTGLKGGYETLIDFTSYVIERVAK